MSLPAYYFDAKSSRRQPVQLSASVGRLVIEGMDVKQRVVPIANIRVSEKQGRAPRTLRFAGDSTFCEVEQSPALDALLVELDYRTTVVVHLQSRWRWVFASFAGLLLFMALSYYWGLPWCAETLAPHVPASVMHSLSDTTLAQLDKYLLKPSALSEQRRKTLQEGFMRMVDANVGLRPYRDQISLNFRSAPNLGPNAFALPDGKVVLLDELVSLLDSDEEIWAVLAHEIGHVELRHGIRQLIQSSVVAAVTVMWLGDISVVATTLGTVVLNSGYSRSMELEADHYGAKLLRQQGKSPTLLASALEKLEIAHNMKENASDRDTRSSSTSSPSDWISSHPDTAERTRLLREN